MQTQHFTFHSEGDRLCNQRGGYRVTKKSMYTFQFGHILMFSCFSVSLSSFFPTSSFHLSCQERAEKATDSAPASQRGCPVSGGDLSWGGGGWGGRDLPFPPSLPHPFLWPWGPARGGHSKALQGQDEGSARGQLLQRWAWLPGRHHGATSFGYLSHVKEDLLTFQIVICLENQTKNVPLWT